MSQWNMLDNLCLRKYRFRLEVTSEMQLDEFKGVSIRGALMSGFKHTVCMNRIEGRLGECATCRIQEQCSYFYLFETKEESVPSPVVLQVPLQAKRFYKPGEQLAFNLILIGPRAIDYFGFFLLSVKRTGLKAGLGKRRKTGWGKYRLLGIDALGLGEDAKLLYSADEDLLIEQEIDINNALIQNQSDVISDAPVRLEFVTPLRLVRKVDGRRQLVSVDDLTFPIVLERIAHRLSLLNQIHCGGDALPVEKLTEAAQSIKLEPSVGVRWYDWEYYSTRQNMRTPLGGILGPVQLWGDLSPFWIYLKWAELVHLGKATSFGLGQYELNPLIDF